MLFLVFSLNSSLKPRFRSPETQAIIPTKRELMKPIPDRFRDENVQKTHQKLKVFLTKTIYFSKNQALYGKLVRQPDHSLMTRPSMEERTAKPKDWNPTRRVGRPCQRWTHYVYQLAVGAFGSESALIEQLSAPGPNH